MKAQIIKKYEIYSECHGIGSEISFSRDGVSKYNIFLQASEPDSKGFQRSPYKTSKCSHSVIATRAWFIYQTCRNLFINDIQLGELINNFYQELSSRPAYVG